MIIFFDEKLRASQLSLGYLEELKRRVMNDIKAGEQTMTEIREQCKEDNDDIWSIEDKTEMKIRNIADDVIEGITIYCTFDVEVEIQ